MTGITQSVDGVVVSCGETQYKADYCVVTIPVAVLQVRDLRSLSLCVCVHERALSCTCVFDPVFS